MSSTAKNIYLELTRAFNSGEMKRCPTASAGDTGRPNVFLSEEDIELANLSFEELVAVWNHWLEQSQATNEFDQDHYEHGVFADHANWPRGSANDGHRVDVHRRDPNPTPTIHGFARLVAPPPPPPARRTGGINATKIGGKADSRDRSGLRIRGPLG